MTTIEPARPSDLAEIRSLMRRYAAGIPVDLAYQRFEAELAALPAPYVPPRGLLLVARAPAGEAQEAIVGIGAYRPLGDGIAEVKRMYVLPFAQGQGLGRRLLVRLMEDARASGHTRLRLDTHRPTMHVAIALYRSLGFAEIPPYGPNPGGRLAFFEARLAPADSPTPPI